MYQGPMQESNTLNLNKLNYIYIQQILYPIKGGTDNSTHHSTQCAFAMKCKRNKSTPLCQMKSNFVTVNQIISFSYLQSGTSNSSLYSFLSLVHTFYFGKALKITGPIKLPTTFLKHKCTFRSFN